MSKYLAIKNWKTYQNCRDGKPSDWVRDYTDKDAGDPEYSQLTMTQRYVLDACCRLRGRFGKNLTNDPLWICRAAAIKPRERHNATTAIQELINSGFLIPTNQQVNSLEEKRIEDKRGEEMVEQPQNLVVRIPLKTPEPKPSPELGPDDLVFNVLREIGIPARNPELTVLVASAIEAKARLPNWTAEKAALHMIERGTGYKSSWIWNTQFKKSWKSWFQDQCYDQDPEAWKKPEARNGHSGKSKLERNLDELSTLD